MTILTDEAKVTPGEREKLAYLKELFSDRALISRQSSLFYHIERLIDKEIFDCRCDLFNSYGIFTISDEDLPDGIGPKVVKQRKVYMPDAGNIHFNFVGRILGPNGSTAKCLQQCLGVKIMVRGRGSTRDKKKEEANIGKPSWEHLNDRLHILLSTEDSENRADARLDKASQYVEAFLKEGIGGPHREDKLKQMQLMELSFRKDSKPWRQPPAHHRQNAAGFFDLNAYLQPSKSSLFSSALLPQNSTWANLAAAYTSACLAANGFLPNAHESVFSPPTHDSYFTAGQPILTNQMSATSHQSNLLTGLLQPSASTNAATLADSTGSNSNSAVYLPQFAPPFANPHQQQQSLAAAALALAQLQYGWPSDVGTADRYFGVRQSIASSGQNVHLNQPKASSANGVGDSAPTDDLDISTKSSDNFLSSIVGTTNAEQTLEQVAQPSLTSTITNRDIDAGYAVGDHIQPDTSSPFYPAAYYGLSPTTPLDVSMCVPQTGASYVYDSSSFLGPPPSGECELPDKRGIGFKQQNKAPSNAATTRRSALLDYADDKKPKYPACTSPSSARNGTTYRDGVPKPSATPASRRYSNSSANRFRFGGVDVLSGQTKRHGLSASVKSRHQLVGAVEQHLLPVDNESEWPKLSTSNDAVPSTTVQSDPVKSLLGQKRTQADDPVERNSGLSS